MEVKLKDRLKGTGLGMMKSVEAFYQRITKKLTIEALEVPAASSIPYEVSEAYRAHLEMEQEQSQALVEAHRQALHCQ